jgi:hypothetical protein
LTANRNDSEEATDPAEMDLQRLDEQLARRRSFDRPLFPFHAETAPVQDHGRKQPRRLTDQVDNRFMRHVPNLQLVQTSKGNSKGGYGRNASHLPTPVPIFSLAFCIFKKNDYCQTVTPALQGLKFKWFGHDGVALHEREIVKKMAPFSFLRIDKLRNEFMDDLNIIVSNAPMRVVASAIRKDKLKQQYAYPENPYRLALLFCLERAYMFLAKKGHHVDVCHVVCESRGKKEDAELELEFRRIIDGKHHLQDNHMPCFDIIFSSKQSNAAGLQLADLIARPIGLHALRPNQPNKAYDIIQPKLCGLKFFPW